MVKAFLIGLAFSEQLFAAQIPIEGGNRYAGGWETIGKANRSLDFKRGFIRGRSAIEGVKLGERTIQRVSGRFVHAAAYLQPMLFLKDA